MTILFFDFFGSDQSKMDQTRKFGEQTSRILEFNLRFIPQCSASSAYQRFNKK